MLRISRLIKPPLVRVSSIAQELARDARGATAVEFALVATPFFGLILLILQVGLFHFSVQSLDYATRQAGRIVMTNQVPGSISSASSFKTKYICPQVFWAISCDKLVVNSFKVGKSSDASASSGVYTYIDSSSRQLKSPVSDPTQQSFCLGGPGDYIYLDVAYPYPNFVAKLLSSVAPATFLMRSSTVVYNEPKKNAASSC